MRKVDNQNIFPDSWKLIEFRSACDSISLNGIKVKQKQYLTAGIYPVIDQGQNLIGGYYNDESLLVKGDPPFIVFGDHTRVKKYINFKFIAGADGIKVLKPKSFFIPKLFFYLLHSISLPEKGYARHFQFLQDKIIPLPPYDEQERIVAKIEELFSSLDKGIESLKAAQQRLKIYRQSVLKWAFEGRFTRKNALEGVLPEGWNWIKLKEACDIIGGVTKGRDLKGKSTIKLPYLRVANVQDGYLILDDIRMIEVLPSDREKYRLQYGDILYTEGGDKDKLGRGTIWRNELENCIHQNHIFRARPKSSNFDSKYISYYSQSKDAKDYFFKHAKQTTNLASINLTILSELPLPFPSSIEEQQTIVTEVETRLSICENLEENIDQELKQGEALRQSILTKAFEGKLVLQDTRYELEVANYNKKEEIR